MKTYGLTNGLRQLQERLQVDSPLSIETGGKKNSAARGTLIIIYNEDFLTARSSQLVANSKHYSLSLSEFSLVL
jgi:hypothetical protein